MCEEFYFKNHMQENGRHRLELNIGILNTCFATRLAEISVVDTLVQFSSVQFVTLLKQNVLRDCRLA